MNANSFAAIRSLTLTNPLATTIFPTTAGGTTRALVGIPQNISGGTFDGVPFRVRAVINAVPGTSGNGTFSVYWDSATTADTTTLTGDKIFLTSGAVALGTQANSTFILQAILVWDSKAQRLAGVNETSFHTIATPLVLFSGAFATTATNNPVVASGITNAKQLNFYATALFGTTSVTNVATLTELSLEQI